MESGRSLDESVSPVPAAALPPAQPVSGTPAAQDFRDSFGEELRDVLDVRTWRLGGDLADCVTGPLFTVRPSPAQGASTVSPGDSSPPGRRGRWS
jgi:hypothetical protein